MFAIAGAINCRAVEYWAVELLVAIRKDLHIAAPELVDGIQQADGILVPVGTEGMLDMLAGKLYLLCYFSIKNVNFNLKLIKSTLKASK